MGRYYAWPACVLGLFTSLVGILLMADHSHAWGGLLLGLLAGFAASVLIRDLVES